MLLMPRMRAMVKVWRSMRNLRSGARIVPGVLSPGLVSGASVLVHRVLARRQAAYSETVVSILLGSCSSSVLTDLV